MQENKEWSKDVATQTATDAVDKDVTTKDAVAERRQRGGGLLMLCVDGLRLTRCLVPCRQLI